MVEVQTGYMSVTRAAELLQVSKSTLWRWIKQGDLPAYRFGHRCVLIKQRDLDKLIKPARGEVTSTHETTPSATTIIPLTEEEVNRGLEALRQARALGQRILARRQGQPLPDSTPLICEAREDRSRQLLKL